VSLPPHSAYIGPKHSTGRVGRLEVGQSVAAAVCSVLCRPATLEAQSAVDYSTIIDHFVKRLSVSSVCLSVHLSVLSIDRCSSMQQFAAVGLAGRRYRLSAARPASSNNCKQCRAVSRHRIISAVKLLLTRRYNDLAGPYFPALKLVLARCNSKTWSQQFIG